MKRVEMKLIALALAASSVLSGCGIMGSASNEQTSASNEQNASAAENEGSTQAGENEITDLVLTHLASTEISTFNLLNSQSQRDVQYLTNMVDGLVEVDTNGQPVPCIATDWGSEDGGQTWTFHLRDDVTWVDVNGEEKAKCTAQDFLTGMEWILNFHKNDSANVSMPSEMIEGAKEYYEYTKTLSEEEAYALNAGEGSKFREMVKIDTPDDYTLVYHCTAPKPYFYTVAAYICMYPMPQGMVDELGVEGVQGMDNTTMWYNGAYLMTSYVQGNEKTLVPNPAYWDKECTRFNTVTIKMVESSDVAFQLYQAGDLDYVDLTESALTTIARDPNNEYYDYLVPAVPSKYSYQMHFNYNKNNEDGTKDTNWNTAIANEAFRKSWYYGLNLSEYWKRTNAIDPFACENNFYTMPGLVYTSDGTEYTELVREAMGLKESDGVTPARVDTALAEQYKQQAIEELTALGVTFPIEADYYISASSQTALDTANVLSQAFTDGLGDDYVKLNICTYISSVNTEVVTPHLHSFVINGWGADYGDPQNYLGQEVYGNVNAYYSQNYSYINEITETDETNADLIASYQEYSDLVAAADAITTDLDARYQAYAEAEAYLLEHVFTLPCNYSVGWCLSKIDNDTKSRAMFGSQDEKMKDWGTKVDGYTSEEKGVAAQIAAYTEENA